MNIVLKIETGVGIARPMPRGMKQASVYKMERAVLLRAMGLTYDKIGKDIKVSRERVREILHKAHRLGLDSMSREQVESAAVSAAERAKLAAERVFREERYRRAAEEDRSRAAAHAAERLRVAQAEEEGRREAKATREAIIAPGNLPGETVYDRWVKAGSPGGNYARFWRGV